MALETVVVAIGVSDNERIDKITDIVVDVAGPTGADVVLVHVFSEPEFSDTADRLDFDPGTATPDEVAKRFSPMRKMADRLEEAGVSVAIRGDIGDKGERVVDVAVDSGADLLFVGGRRRSPTGKAVFGSTAQQVMLDAPCPVTFVRGE